MVAKVHCCRVGLRYLAIAPAFVNKYYRPSIKAQLGQLLCDEPRARLPSLYGGYCYIRVPTGRRGTASFQSHAWLFSVACPRASDSSPKHGRTLPGPAYTISGTTAPGGKELSDVQFFTYTCPPSQLSSRRLSACVAARAADHMHPLTRAAMPAALCQVGASHMHSWPGASEESDMSFSSSHSLCHQDLLPALIRCEVAALTASQSPETTLHSATSCRAWPRKSWTPVEDRLPALRRLARVPKGRRSIPSTPITLLASRGHLPRDVDRILPGHERGKGHPTDSAGTAGGCEKGRSRPRRSTGWKHPDCAFPSVEAASVGRDAGSDH
ncbi:hypothetical protein B0T19DRAFT_30341 [Cercophora scortea]|uniref:Uncharacterized protein n=1 Tax=Cercophora scortea TaxID=314031 RepID=A0AAE0J4M4_9PEZI|nr:hypothetical protein B0T19DRAFT_30341 [Cercophora scortea]